MREWTLRQGDCLEVLPTLPRLSVDCVITDPPYPEIDREYGRLTEAEWWNLMMGVVKEVRRVLTPTGSAVFILQPNSERVGRMRGWLWRFMLWVTEEWNMVQDVWWWNFVAQPTGHTRRHVGLCRSSVKACVWCGPADCRRDQDSVLWTESEANRALRATARCGRTGKPSGHSVNEQRMTAAALERGGTTPFNLLPFANTNSTNSAGSHGHGAGTPLALMRWWTRYVCPPGGTVLDPFAGSGTAGLAALAEGRNALLIERHPPHCDIIRRRLGQPLGPLFDATPEEDVPPPSVQQSLFNDALPPAVPAVPAGGLSLNAGATS
jgi:DNA modification methylase